MNALTKYGYVYLVGLQGNFIYRWNFLIRGAFSLAHLAVVFILWSAAYAGATHIGGFSLAETLTYFVALLCLQFTIGAFNEDYQISEEIRNGLINQFLLKPVDYYLYRVGIFAAARSVSSVLVLVPLLLLLPLLRGHLVLPDEAWRLALGLPAVALAGVLQFTIAYCFGLLSFWFLEIQGFVILSYAIETLLGGAIFPLDLMPPSLFAVSQILPFAYQMYFPAAILTGRMEYAGAVQGLGFQVCWVALFIILARLLWDRGLRRHTAVGG